MKNSPRLLLDESQLPSPRAVDPGLFPSIKARRLLEAPQPFEKILRGGKSGADQDVVDTLLAFIWVAAAWRITRDKSYRDLLNRWLQVFQAEQVMQIPGFALGNYDLMVGHHLLSFALMDDLLRGVFDAAFEAAVRKNLLGQARRAYADLTNPQVFPSYAYEQNHLIIPVCSLGLAAMAIQEEVPEAAEWLSFARNFLKRSFDVIAHDGWFFEGIGYWQFTMQFPVCYAAALKRITGEDLFHRPPFQASASYLMHNVLPNGKFVFDFSDWGARVNPDGVGFQPGYDQPWHSVPTFLPHGLLKLLAREQKDISWKAFLERLPKPPETSEFDGALQLLLSGNNITPTSPSIEPPISQYFPDMEVLHWRSSWTDPNATALAFKSGPPAGHHIGAMLACHPDWKPALGHAQPDAGAFILAAHGVFLANDTGYTGKKETADHNSILVDGIGQHKGGTPWSTFEGKPYKEYDRIRMENVWQTPTVAAATAVFDAAYDDALQLRKIQRHLILVDGRFLLIVDEIESSLAHEYEWRLHSDCAARLLTPNRFVIDNGPARLVIQSLDSTASHVISPTVVETELYDLDRSRPQQRGFHIALKSRHTANFRFLIAMNIQRTSDRQKAFSARLVSEKKIELKDNRGSCLLTIPSSANNRPVFAYSLSDLDGKLRSADSMESWP